MSGGGPPGHHPHGRQVPPSNSAWNHLQVPNYFPRQPQHAHMSNDPAMLHQPTWHTPTPDPASIVPPSLKSVMPPTTHHHQYQQQQQHHHHHKIGGVGGVSTQMTGGHPEWPQYHQQQPRRPPVVDLSLTRNGSGQQNGEQQQQQQLPLTAPISLSVRDANRINSLPPGALEIHTVAPPMIAVETPPPPPALQQLAVAPAAGRAQALSPKTLSPGLQQDPKSKRAPGKRVDSILERLNPAVQAAVSVPNDAAPPQDGGGGGILMTAAASSSSHDENSNSSGILNVPTPNSNNDDVVSPYSNDDSLDGGSGSKSRRKRKPSKTVRVAASVEEQEVAQQQSSRTSGGAAPETEPVVTATTAAPPGSFEEAGLTKGQQQQQQSEEMTDETAIMKVTTKKVTERRRSGDCVDGGGGGGGNEGERNQEEAAETPAVKTRRKASSEAETIDDIAAMVREGLKQREGDGDSRVVSVIRGTTGTNKDGTAAATTPLKEASEIVAALTDTPVKETGTNPTSTPTQQPPPKFVEVENKLEEMFAGIEDTSDPIKSSLDSDSKDAAPTTSIEDELLKMEASTASSQQDVTSTSNDLATPTKKSPKKGKRKQQKRSLRRGSDAAANSSTVEPACANPTPNKKQKTSAGAGGGGSGGGTSKKTSNKSAAAAAAATTSKQQTGGFASKGSLKKGAAAGKLDSVRDVYAYDSGSNASSSRSRGPFIQIKGPRDSPLSVNVVNTPTNDDDPDHKRPHHHKAKKSYHDDSEYRHKVRSKGLHCSTLSHQYDAQTKDASWMCAFCKRGPHATETTGFTHPGSVPGGAATAPGDLFGPYLITANSPAFERRLDDPYDKQFKSKKFARCLDATGGGGVGGSGGGGLNQKTANLKKKRKYSDTLRRTSESGDDLVYLGITKTGPGAGESETKYEIWAHEDCIVWSQGTYLVGPKIVGLEEAVWTSCNIACAVCQLRGANIFCLRRGCLQGAVHVCCARQSGWHFDDGQYKTLCPDHRTIEDDP